jgi:hypothetical protein
MTLAWLPFDVSDFVTFFVTSARSDFQIKRLQRKGHNPPAEPGYATIRPEHMSPLTAVLVQDALHIRLW